MSKVLGRELGNLMLLKIRSLFLKEVLALLSSGQTWSPRAVCCRAGPERPRSPYPNPFSGFYCMLGNVQDLEI
jgi:hypothetical protein